MRTEAPRIFRRRCCSLQRRVACASRRFLLSPSRVEKVSEDANDSPDVANRSHDGMNESGKALLLSHGDAIPFPTRSTRSPTLAFDSGCSCQCRAPASSPEDAAIAHPKVPIQLGEEPVAVSKEPIVRQESTKHFRKIQSPSGKSQWRVGKPRLQFRRSWLRIGKIRDVSTCEDTRRHNLGSFELSERLSP